MKIVSLNQAAKLTGKSTSVISGVLNNKTLKADEIITKGENGKKDKTEWKINTDDLYALYPEKEQQKCERLEAELSNCREQLLSLENQLKDEISKREALELLSEQTKLEIDADVRTTHTHIEFYNEFDPTNVFLRQHIDDFINALEPFSSSSYFNINLAICFRLLGNYNHELELFKQKKCDYEDECRRNPQHKSENGDAFFEKFTYLIKNKDVSDYIATRTTPAHLRQRNKNEMGYWWESHFKYES